MNQLLFFALTVLLAHACGQSTAPTEPTQQQVNRDLEAVNRQLALAERTRIDGFIERKGWQMGETGTGLRYTILDDGIGQTARDGQRATVNYRVSLLDGTVVYSSDSAGAREFLIGQDNVESGLHEGITLMRQGGKAIFILPSHLAHGLSGDGDKIPPRATVVYHIELLRLR